MKKMILFISIFLLGMSSYGQAWNNNMFDWDYSAVDVPSDNGRINRNSVYHWGRDSLNQLVLNRIYYFYLKDNFYVLAYRANDNWKIPNKTIGYREERDFLLYRFNGDLEDVGNRERTPDVNDWVQVSDVLRTDYVQCKTTYVPGQIAHTVFEYDIVLNKGSCEGYDDIVVDGNNVTITITLEYGIFNKPHWHYIVIPERHRLKLTESGMFKIIK